MALPLYLAMTAAETRKNQAFPQKTAYMACHFSPYGTGLSNLPLSLPEDAILILNDRTPIGGHNPEFIANQLLEQVERHRCMGVLLDFQRSGNQEAAALARQITTALHCPVGVSEQYAADGDWPVFLPPVPLDVSIKEYLHPWSGRKIWLEAALDGMVITLTEDGCRTTPLPLGQHPNGTHRDGKLHCHYNINIENDAQFTLFRTREDLDALLKEAETLGVTLAFGLWQELGR